MTLGNGVGRGRRGDRQVGLLDRPRRPLRPTVIVARVGVAGVGGHGASAVSVAFAAACRTHAQRTRRPRFRRFEARDRPTRFRAADRRRGRPSSRMVPRKTRTSWTSGRPRPGPRCPPGRAVVRDRDRIGHGPARIHRAGHCIHRNRQIGERLRGTRLNGRRELRRVAFGVGGRRRNERLAGGRGRQHDVTNEALPPASVVTSVKPR